MAVSVRKFSESLQMASPLITRIRSHRYYPLLMIGLLVLSVACMHVWQRVAVMQLVKDVGRLRHQERSLQDESKKLASEIAALSMSARIETYASDSLGLRPVSPERLVTLIRDQRSVVDRDELATMFSSITRVADYLPSVTSAEASAAVLEDVDELSDDVGETQR